MIVIFLIVLSIIYSLFRVGDMYGIFTGIITITWMNNIPCHAIKKKGRKKDMKRRRNGSRRLDGRKNCPTKNKKNGKPSKRISCNWKKTLNHCRMKSIKLAVIWKLYRKNMRNFKIKKQNWK